MMSREQLDAMLAEIRAARAQTLTALADLDEKEFPLPTTDKRWSEVRRVLLRFGDHLREHVTQIDAIRAGIGRSPSMPERILARSEEAWGLLLASMVGLQDDDLDKAPRPGDWTIRQVLEHFLKGENGYRDQIVAARTASRQSENPDL